MEKITKEHHLSQSKNIISENLEQLKTIFPQIFKEGKIDKEELLSILGDEIESNEEYYRFTWAGKSIARREANKPSTATLRPDREGSKDWDTTQNIFIEGDNLEVLKLLQKSYANRIKMIYIDPPYNTGKDFVYKDNYNDNLGNYLAITGQVDEEGRRISTNSESDGRYHSNWLNMMYPRLKLARNLMKEDGIIFISIDDNELINLTKICNEIFGEENFISHLVWQKKTGSADANHIAVITESILLYSKNISNVVLNRNYEAHDNDRFKFKDEYFDERGPYYLDNLDRGTLGYHESLDYDVEAPDGTSIFPNGRTFKFNDGWRWKWGKDKLQWGLQNGYVDVLKSNSKDIGWGVYYKIYLNVDNEGNKIQRSSPFKNLIQGILNTHASNEAKDILKSTGLFSNPKPVGLIKYLLNICLLDNDFVLDFFAGSGTTAHATMQLNSEDADNRKFICVQLPEPTDEKSEAYKAGYKTISEITKERIRRAGEKVKSEMKDDLFSEQGKTLDVGFRAFKLDSSNISAWDGNPDALEDNLFNAGSNIKENRTEEDVLYEILLKYGLDLTMPIEQKAIAGKQVFNIGIGALFICLGDNITTAVAEGIGKWKEELQPATSKVIFKDTGFTDVEKTNSMQILKRFGILEVNTI